MICEDHLYTQQRHTTYCAKALVVRDGKRGSTISEEEMIASMKTMKKIINIKAITIDDKCDIDDKQLRINALKWMKKRPYT